MKKTFTKLAGGFMAASMILGTVGVAAPSVFAANPTGAVSVEKNDKADHTYGIYQIFSGAKSGSSLINIDWGSNVDKAEVAKDDFKNAVADALGLKKTTKTENGSDVTVYRKTVGTGADAKTYDYKLDTAQNVAEAITDAKTISGLQDGTATAFGDADKLAKAFADVLTGDAVATDTANGNDKLGEFSGLATGYYLIKDVKNPTSDDGEEGAQTKYIVTTVFDGETTAKITSKSSVPEHEKKVKDINDSTGVESGWQDAADYDTGDKIPFRLQATFGDTIDNYNSYYMAFIDNMSKGLSYDNNVKIILDLDGNENTDADQFVLADNKVVVPTGFPNTNGTIKDAENNNFASTIYKWSISDVFTDFVNDKTADEYKGKTIKELIVANQSTAKVWAYYTATLDKDNCKQGAPGNPNESKLEYQTNPDKEQGGEPEKNETPEDKNIVFTIQEVVNKFDEKNEGLTGAGFTLYKEYAVPAGTTSDTYKLTKTDAKTGAEYEIQLVKGSKIKAGHDKLNRGSDIQDSDIEDAKYYEVKTVTPSADGKSFTSTGLDDGNYVLVETTIPDNYNSAADIKFTITISHSETGDGTNESPLEIGTITADKHTNTKVTNNKDTISTDVVNRKGSTLPSTGGIGTTIFYIVGAAAAVTAVVLLTTRRRANKED